jgi:hypothetical protein
MLQAGGRVLYDYDSVLLEVGSRDVFEKAVQRGRKAVDATRESAQPQAWRCFVMHALYSLPHKRRPVLLRGIFVFL